MTLPAVLFVSDDLAAPLWTSSTPKDKASDDTTIELEVGVVPEATGYRFYGSETPSFTPGPGNLLQEDASNSFDHTGLDIGDTWYYRATAFNLSLTSDVSAEGSATVLARIPGVPTINTVGFTYASLEASVPWTPTAPLTATSFELEYDKGACGSGWEGEADSPPDEAASPATRSVLERYSYRFKVRAKNASGNSAYSAWSNTIVTAQAPNAPTGLTATKSVGNPDSEIDVAWTDPTTGTLDDVEIHRASSEFGSYSLRHTVAAAAEAWTDTVGDGETWWYKVRGKNDCGIGPGPFSSADDATTDVSLPGAMTGLSLTPKQATADTMVADFLATDATTYDVYLSLSPMGADPTVGGTAVSPDPSGGPIDVDVAALLGAGADDQVYLNARGVNAGGNGPWGTEVNGYTHLEIPDMTNPTQDTGDCPGITFDLTLAHLNTDGDARSETLDVQRDDGSGYGAISGSPFAALTTAINDTGASLSTVGYRAKYASESSWRTRSVSPLCPE